MMAAPLTPEQEEATKDFIEKVNAKYRRKLGPVSWSTAVRFLCARKFDVLRALVLFEQHELTRQREGLKCFDPLKEPLQSELLTGKFTILVRSSFEDVDENFNCVTANVKTRTSVELVG
jgi:tyrosine-protein phosphatase non-receptor type 9